MEAKVEQLGKAFDQNTDVFSESFKMNEGITTSIQKVLGEMARGEKLSFSDSEGGPDWMAYIRYYWLCMLMADFADWLKSISTQTEPEGSILVAKPSDERIVETHIFGG